MAYIKDADINEIRSRADIVDIISGYLQVSPKGKNHVALCPFHDDHNPSLTISREKQIFSCFRCHTSGNVFTFVMDYENVSFVEAVQIVANKIGYQLNVNQIADKTVSKFQEDYEIYDFATKYYANNLFSQVGNTAREYLHNRGITLDIIKEFNLGLALENLDNFFQIATRKNWSIEKLNNLGLINKVDTRIYDTFINRITIPIENIQGQVVGFTGRIYHGENNSAKYLNTKETPIFKKGSILFNYHNAKKYIKEQRSVIVVEGNMDAIKMSAKGFKNVIALMGVALSKEQIELLKRLNVPLILMLDNDNAGLEATIKNGDILANNEIEVKVVRLSQAKDPDEYLENFGAEAMQDNIKHALKYIDFKLEYLKQDKDLTKIEDLILYVKAIINNLNNTDDLTKELIISKISKDYGVDAQILKKEVFKEQTNNYKKVKQHQNTSKPVLTSYQKASHRILYYMLNDSKYINLYQEKLGFFQEKIERMLVSEIIYYSKTKPINVADFTTYLLENEELYGFLQIILSENNNTNIDATEFEACVKAILKIYKNKEIAEINQDIKNELDINKKLELMQRLVNLKKEV